jgi:hypothetical protein
LILKEESEEINEKLQIYEEIMEEYDEKEDNYQNDIEEKMQII